MRVERGSGYRGLRFGARGRGGGRVTGREVETESIQVYVTNVCTHGRVIETSGPEVKTVLVFHSTYREKTKER